MIDFRIKSYLTLDQFTLKYQGKIAYNLKTGLDVRVTTTQKSTYFSRERVNQLILDDTHYLALNFTSICPSKTCYSDFYYYYLVPRTRSSGFVATFLPEAAEYFVQRMTPEIKTVLSKLMDRLLNNYDVVLTDITGIGGTDFSEIYLDHPEVWNMRHSELVKLNMQKVLFDKLNINLERYSRKRVVVLLLHNSELASDLATLIGKTTIPVVLFGNN